MEFRLQPLLILSVLLCFNTFSQELFYSNILHGGVTGAGFDFGNGAGTITKTVDIPIGCTIEKAYLITLQFAPGTLKDSLILNGIKYPFNHFSISSTQFKSDVVSTCIQDKSTINTLDITDDIDPNVTQYSLTCPVQDLSCGEIAFMPFYLYIVFSNNALPKTVCNLFLNPEDVNPNQICELTCGASMNNNFPIGLGICGEWFCDTLQDGSYVKVNNYNIGLIGGQESNYHCGGVHSDFAYYNNQLIGLGNDTADSLMAGTDALADIKGYVNYLDSYVNVTFNYQSPNLTASLFTNPVIALMLSYTTPCDTFSVSVTPDTTICYGEQVQLQATGGVSTGSNSGYEWSASTASQDTSSSVPGLSCSDCPNPIFTGDHSMSYSVRIWNNDSCSVVRPVRINVSRPQKVNCYTGETKCGASTGYIKANALPEDLDAWYVVTPNNDTLDQPIGNTFPNLGAGDYSVYYIDSLGCKSEDTIVTIEAYNNTVADFSVNPTTGSVPLEVEINNQSQNATDFEWLINGVSSGTSPTTFFDTSGVYEIGLVAWEIDASCADTTWKTVLVFDSLMAQLPNVFTPNNDGVNDFFNVKVNLPVSYKLSILNRWGNVVFENEGGLAEGTHKLWDGTAENGDFVTDGTYFYTISFALDNETVDCEVTECEVRKDGFVQVFGE